MLDYVNTEIIAYADDMTLSFDEAYPFRILPWNFNGNREGPYGYHYYSYELGTPAGDNTLGSNGTLAKSYPFLVGCKIIAFCLRQYDTTIYSSTDIVETIGVCYYAITQENTPETMYYKLTQSDIPDGIINPFVATTSISGDDIYWLYNLGSTVITNASYFSSILNFKIGDYNFFTLLFSAGFIVYMGWSAIKWIIPV